MQLVGMLDSPYVRRVAIALQLLEVPFEHRVLSVFSTYEQFRAVNPVVKAPTLVCDDGSTLMDSGLIVEYAESMAGRSLMPATPDAHGHRHRADLAAVGAVDRSRIARHQALYTLNVLHQGIL